MRRRLAHRLRLWADRLDWHGAPKKTMLSFTFERGTGLVVNKDSRGCPLWYYGNDAYERAYDEALVPPTRIDWRLLSRGGDK
jgi:hypothetical protein